MASLLREFRGSAIHGDGEKQPCLLHLVVVDVAVACLYIVVQPLLPRKFAVAPWQFADKLIHDGVVLYALHCESDTLQR